MKILIIGLGSIGKRHLGNILQLGYTDVEVVSRSGILPEPFSHLQVYRVLDDALKGNFFDAVIICTPTAAHTNSLIKLLKARVKRIYVEKPVSHGLDQLDEIQQLAALYENKICVGFDLHFDTGLQKVKTLIDSGSVGEVVSVNAQVGQYLPDWRPHEDYRQGMSAKVETGGGVMLDLVHEFDYLRWLCGPVSTVASLNTNTGTLQIETEEVAEVLLRFKNGVIGTIHLDYLQPKLVRHCLITGQKGTIDWNLAGQGVTLITTDKKEEYYKYDQERNDRLVSIMKSFLSDEEDPRLTTLAEGIESLRVVVAAKQSALQQQFIQLNSLVTTPQSSTE